MFAECLRCGHGARDAAADKTGPAQTELMVECKTDPTEKCGGGSGTRWWPGAGGVALSQEQQKPP